MKATDPSEEVKSALETMESKEEEDVLNAIGKLDSLASREKNIDVIADLNGHKALIAVGEVRLTSSSNVHTHDRILTEIAYKQKCAISFEAQRHFLAQLQIVMRDF